MNIKLFEYENIHDQFADVDKIYNLIKIYLDNYWCSNEIADTLGIFEREYENVENNFLKVSNETFENKSEVLAYNFYDAICNKFDLNEAKISLENSVDYEQQDKRIKAAKKIIDKEIQMNLKLCEELFTEYDMVLY